MFSGFRKRRNSRPIPKRTTAAPARRVPSQSSNLFFNNQRQLNRLATLPIVSAPRNSRLTPNQRKAADLTWALQPSFNLRVQKVRARQGLSNKAAREKVRQQMMTTARAMYVKYGPSMAPPRKSKRS